MSTSIKVIVPPLEIDELEGFSHNDIFHRVAFGRSLMNVISHSSESGLVLSLDGKWGEGKTTFIKMWQGMLEENKIPNVYIDAFANDYIDDPFIVLASTINTYTTGKIQELNGEVQSHFKQKAMGIAKQLLTNTAKIAIKVATSGLVDGTVLESAADELSASVSDSTTKYIEDRFAAHSGSVGLFSDFKLALAELPAKLQPTTEDTDSAKNIRPLVVIVDELDRCRPDFAVEMLEKIKHFFMVPNVVFVLVVNKQQLEASIACIYGIKADASLYLEKFISIETRLPLAVAGGHRMSRHQKYAIKLCELHGLNNEILNLVGYIAELAAFYNIGLRSLEKVFVYLAVYYCSVTSSNTDAQLLIFICFLKVVNNEVFEDLRHRRLTFEELNAKSVIPISARDWDDIDILRKDLEECLIPWQQLRESNPNSHKLNSGESRLQKIPEIAESISLLSFNI